MRRKKEKKVISPITVFFILIVITIVLSAVLSGLGKIQIGNNYPFSFLSQGNYNTINSVTGELENQIVEVNSLLNRSGIQYIIGNALNNFITFSPLSMLLIMLIGLAVAEKSGLIKTLTLSFNPRTPNYVFTMLIMLFSVILTISSDIGYVIMIPLAALIFMINKRNPLGGIIAAFAGVAGGYGINLMFGSLDIALSNYSTTAAALLDPKYNVGLSGNIFFMVIATICLVIIGTIITEKMVIPKLPSRLEETDELFIVEKNEKRGVIFSCIASLFVVLIFLYMIIPGLPFSGLLLDTTATGYMNQLLGSNSYFQQGLVVTLSAILFVAGLFYGIGAKTIKSDKTVVNYITSSLNSIGYIIVLIFFASEFIAIFKQTNIGTIINVWLINILKMGNISGLPLIIIFFIFVILGNIVLPSPNIKWSMMAPSIVPLFMQSNMTPEFTQMIYRSALSVGNLVTPLLAFYCVYLGYLQIYNKKEDTITIGTSFKYIRPYFLIFSLMFLLLIVIWYIIGAPIGPGVGPTL